MVDASFLLDWQVSLEQHPDSLIIRFKSKPADLKITFNPIQISQIDKKQQEMEKKQNIMAIYGIIKLKDYSYLIVVTKANIVGMIMQKAILAAEKFEFIPLQNRAPSLQDKLYIDLVQQVFNTKTYYFSEEYDLTSSLQNQINLTNKKNHTPQYFMNLHLIQDFINANVDTYVPAFISGLVSIKYVKVITKDCDIILISRRDKRRMGRRFISRGADSDGNCSNYAETEQILAIFGLNDNQIYSFVQTRGSMPFQWSQKPTLKWAPKGSVSGTEASNVQICKNHFDDNLIKEQVLVNLIDKKGNQLILGEYYKKMIQLQKNASLKYVWFDFHHECRNMQYDNLGKLIEMIQEELKTYGFFSAKYGKLPQSIQIIQEQKGMVRTNCIDCLDRTNVFQSAVARHVLWHVLAQQGITKSGVKINKVFKASTFEKFPSQLEAILREMWTKNADVISTLYTGTGALKTDFTRFQNIIKTIRTGKRTYQGALQDGRNAIQRYVLNNFYDADTQNAVDLMTGKLDLNKYIVKPPGLNPIFTLALLVLFVPIMGYYAATHLTSYHTVLDYMGESHEEKTIHFGTKFILLSLILIGFGGSLLKRIVLAKHQTFIKKPLINH